MTKVKVTSAARKAAALADQRMLDQWAALAESAEKNQLDDAELATLLAAGRSGDQEVTPQLIQGTEYLVFEIGFAWTSRSSQRRLEDILGPLAEAQAEAVKDLLNNERGDVSTAVADELKRSIKVFRRDNSSTVFQPPSTKSRRKKKKLPPYNDVTRVGECLSDTFEEGETTVLPDGEKHKGPFTDQTGHRFVPPSKYHNFHDDFARVDLLDEFENERIQQIATLLFDNHTVAEIVDITGQTRYAVEKAKTKINAKLQPYWDQRHVVSDATRDHSLVPPHLTRPAVIAEAATFPAGLELSLAV